MECKPIFDFLKEVRMPSIKTPYSAEEIEQYERNVLLVLLYDMKACLTECLMNNPSFDVSFIIDELKIDRAIWKAKETHMGGSVVMEKADRVFSFNPKVRQLWKEKPETRIPDLMLFYIDEAERFVNKEYLCSSKDEKVEGNTKQVSQKKRVEEKSVLNGKEVAERFGLPFNNVKDKQWRDRNDFPYTQLGKGGKVVYYADDVMEWVENRKAS